MLIRRWAGHTRNLSLGCTSTTKSGRNDEEARATLPKADLWGDKRTEAEWHWLCDLYCNEKYMVCSI